jgi:hypothetical protein
MLPNSLVVFDDQLLARGQERELVDSVYVRGRNAGVSVLYLSQDFYRTPLTARRNSDYFFLFKGINERDLSLMYRDVGGSVDYVTFKRLYAEATREKYTFLFVDTLTGSYYANLTQKLHP